MSATAYDQSRAEAFAGRMLELLNGGALGDDLRRSSDRVVRCVSAELDDATSQGACGEAVLHERYVRERLGAMTAGRIARSIRDRAATASGRARRLSTRAASPDNLAVEAQWITSLSTARKTSSVLTLAENLRPLSALSRGDGRGERADGPLCALLAHPPARSRHERPPRGGRLAPRPRLRTRPRALLLAERFPQSTFNGLDLSADAIAHASGQAAERSLANVRFEQRDQHVRRRCRPEAFDYVTTFDAVHDQARPLALLKGAQLWRRQASDGTYLMQDIQGSSHVHENLDHPEGPCST